MSEFKITLPESHVVTSREKHVTVVLANLSPEIIAKLALHGLTQKIADSAASAKAIAEKEGGNPDDIAKARMEATLAELVAGNWTTRVAGGGVDPLVARIRVKFGAMLREGAKEVWKGLKDADDKGEQLDALFATQDDDFQAALTEDAKGELAAEAKAKAKMSKLTIGLKLS